MGQRGGSVVTFVRYGKKVAEPIVEEGQADVLIAFEKLEALRYAHFLKKDGAIIVNEQRIDPITVVTGAAQYPENIIENLEKEYNVYKVNAMEEALKLGNSRVFNIIVLGVAQNIWTSPKKHGLKLSRRLFHQKPRKLIKKHIYWVTKAKTVNNIGEDTK